MKIHVCKQCGKVVKSLGVASHRSMHYRDDEMLKQFDSRKKIEHLKSLMKEERWCRRDIKDVYWINDRVLNLLLSK